MVPIGSYLSSRSNSRRPTSARKTCIPQTVTVVVWHWVGKLEASRMESVLNLVLSG